MLEWNEEKRRKTLRERGVDFRDAALIFEGTVLTREDTRKDYGETRLISMGMADGNIYVVTYTMRGEIIRIISAWQGGRKEHEQYQKGIAR